MTPSRGQHTAVGSLPTVCTSKLVNGFEVHFVQVHLLKRIQHFLLVSWVCDPNLETQRRQQKHR